MIMFGAEKKRFFSIRGQTAIAGAVITLAAAGSSPSAVESDRPKNNRRDYKLAERAAWLAWNRGNFKIAGQRLGQIQNPNIKLKARTVIGLAKAGYVGQAALGGNFARAERQIGNIQGPQVRKRADWLIDLIEASEAAAVAYDNNFKKAKRIAALVKAPAVRKAVKTAIAASEEEYRLLNSDPVVWDKADKRAWALTSSLDQRLEPAFEGLNLQIENAYRDIRKRAYPPRRP